MKKYYYNSTLLVYEEVQKDKTKQRIRMLVFATAIVSTMGFFSMVIKYNHRPIKIETVITPVLVDSTTPKEKFLRKLMTSIRYQESGNCDTIIGDGGDAYGSYQIHDICVRDINNAFGTSYTHNGCFNKDTAEQIFLYTMARYTEIYESVHHSPPSWEWLIQSWNGGTQHGDMTKLYLEKLKSKL